MENRRNLVFIGAAVVVFIVIFLYEPPAPPARPASPASGAPSHSEPNSGNSETRARAPRPPPTPLTEPTREPGPGAVPPPAPNGVTPTTHPDDPSVPFGSSPTNAPAPTPSDPTTTAPATDGQPSSDERPAFAVTADGLREAMAFARYDIRECYDEWLKLGAPIKGQVEIGFTLEPGGDRAQPTQFRIRDTSLAHTAMEGCIANAVKDLDFEPPASRLDVTYRLGLSPDGPPDAGAPTP